MIEYDKMYESIRLSLMKKDTDINSEGKAEYFKQISATVKVPDDYYSKDNKYGVNYLKEILNSMFEDLVAKNPYPDADSLGIWIKIGSDTIENAISLQTLKDIEEYSKEDVDPLYEFFMLSLNINEKTKLKYYI